MVCESSAASYISIPKQKPKDCVSQRMINLCYRWNMKQSVYNQLMCSEITNEWLVALIKWRQQQYDNICTRVSWLLLTNVWFCPLQETQAWTEQKGETGRAVWRGSVSDRTDSNKHRPKLMDRRSLEAFRIRVYTLSML